MFTGGGQQNIFCKWTKSEKNLDFCDNLMYEKNFLSKTNERITALTLLQILESSDVGQYVITYGRTVS